MRFTTKPCEAPRYTTLSSITLHRRDRVRPPLDEERLTRKRSRERARAERKALEAAERGRAARRRRLTLLVGPLGVLAMAGVVAIATSGQAGPARVSGSVASAGLQATAVPWAPQYSGLATRLAALKLPPENDAAYHVHAALRVYVNGKRVPVPADIGIEPEAASLAPLHTHDASGIIHIESSEPYAFTLGQLFTVWGVKFTNTQLGGYLAANRNVLAVYANGKPVRDPAGYVMNPHDDIVVGYGMPGSFPTSFQYDWAAAGL